MEVAADEAMYPPPSPAPPLRVLHDIPDVDDEEAEECAPGTQQPVRQSDKSSSGATEDSPTSSPSISEMSSDSNASPLPTPSTPPSSARTSLTDMHSPSASISDPCMPFSILLPTTLPRSSSFTVSFAPLPELDPRRRTSTVPLGVAARSRLLRSRRVRTMGPVEGIQHAPDEGTQNANPDAITEQQQESASPQSLEPEMTVQIYAGDDDTCSQGSGTRKPPAPFQQSIWRSASSGLATSEEEIAQDEDALLTLGRMMRGGARTLWRRVSKGSLRGRGQERDMDGSREAEGESTEVEVAIVGVGVTKKRGLLRRSASEPPSCAVDGTGNLTVRVLVKEPRQLSVEDPTKGSPVEEHDADSLKRLSHGEGYEEEEGRVWEERVGEDVTRRMHALSVAQGHVKAKGRGAGLVKRFSSLRGSRRP